MDDLALVLRPDRRRAMILLWTGLGAAMVSIALLSLLLASFQLSGHQVRPVPGLGVLGLLVVLHVNLIYARVLRLTVDGHGIAFRNLLGTRRLAWADVLAVDSVSALAPAGRGGNVSRLRVHTPHGVMTIPDVFTMRRDALRALLLQRSGAARA